MSAKPTDRVVNHITKIADTWQKRMLLSHWTIEHVFLESFSGDDGNEDFKVTAITETRWQYLQAKIKWYLPSAVRHDNDELERVLVHELCHVLLSPEQSLIDTRIEHDTASTAYTASEHDALAERNYEHLELATEMVTRAILAGWNRQ